VVHPLMLGEGWTLASDLDGATGDQLMGKAYLREAYLEANPDTSGRVTVPVLWDRQRAAIVSNESAEIIRMFNGAFTELNDTALDLYPAQLQSQIDRVNTYIYHAINNGAYKAGFADGQNAYEAAYQAFFVALDLLDHMLRGRRFLFGDTITEADIRLFPTLFRFDSVYYTRFNLGLHMVRDIPSLKRWLAEMLAIPAIAYASNLDHCRNGYFGRTGNNIVPLGPKYRP